METATTEKLRILIETQGVKKTVAQFKQLEVGVRKIFAGSKATSTKALNNYRKSFKDLNVDINKVNVGVKKFSFEFLGMMFAAMQVSRVMNSLFKGMFDAFKKTTSKTNPLNVALTKLEASFTFLKTSVISAMGPGLEMVTLALAQMAIAIGEMDPDTLAQIGWALATITAAATGIFIGSQFMLGLEAFLTFMKALKAGEYVGIISSLGAGLATIGAVTVGIKGVWDMTQGDVLKGLGNILIGAAWFIPGATGAIVGSIGIGLLLTDAFANKNLTGVDNFTRRVAEALAIGKLLKYNPALGFMAMTVVLTIEMLIPGVSNIKEIFNSMKSDKDQGFFSTLGGIFSSLKEESKLLWSGSDEEMAIYRESLVTTKSKQEDLKAATVDYAETTKTQLNETALPAIISTQDELVTVKDNITAAKNEWDNWQPLAKTLVMNVVRNESNSSSSNTSKYTKSSNPYGG